MYSRVLLTCLFLFSPFFTIAASSVFPTESLWLSDMKPKVGEQIRIYAVVYNGTDTTLTGTITFFVDGKDNGRKDVSLDSGESVVVASPWTATEGEHTFSARFTGNGETASSQTSESVVATVVAPPSEIEKTIEQAKDVSTQIASSSLPIVSSVANAVFETTESIRNAGIEYFEEKVQPKSIATSSPAVAGANTKSVVAAASASEKPKGWFASAAQTASAAALFTFKSMWLFYPILVLLLLLIFRWLYKWATGPRF